MLSFDLIGTKMAFGGREKPIDESENHRGGGSENHILMLLLPIGTVFGLF